MITFSKELAKSNPMNLMAMNSQFADLSANRADPRYALPIGVCNSELARHLHSAGMVTNAGLKPADLYRVFDSNVVEQFKLDEGDNILNRLMPLAQSLPIGATVLQNARASDSGTFVQSMTGEEGTIYDKVDYDFDGTIVPIGQNGFKRSWREGEQLGLEGFNDLMHMQREGLRTHRQGLIGSFMDGHKDAKGQYIVEKGLSWKGVRADTRVDQVDLGAGGLNVDFTSPTLTGEQAKAAFIKLIERRYITNKVTARATFFVSNEIYFNFMRDYSAQYKDVSILNVLQRDLGGQIVEIVPSSVLVGNQVLSMPLESRFVHPLVGMGVSTIAVPRDRWNSPLAFEIVSAVGWKINNDFGGANKAVQYAAS